MSGVIRGLTLRHPWSWAFLHGKDVENRTWRPERQGGHVGMFLALHGGAMPPARGEYWNEITDSVDWMRCQEIGQALKDQAWSLLRDGRGLCVPGIIAVGRLIDVRQDSPSPWAAAGQYHWCLEVTPLPEPIPHRGAQGLWQLEPDALQAVRAAYKASLTPSPEASQ